MNVLQSVRIVFSKTGRARYISHLDLVRTMTRVMRRAEIPLWYTEGFNRHPYLTFAAPLPLGQEGLRETMDLRLEQDMDMTALVERINAALPEGMRALCAAPAVQKAGALVAARYQIDWAVDVAALEKLLAQPQILVEKRTKKKTMKQLDIRPAFESARLETVEGGARMTVTLPCGQENLNPTLLAGALNEQQGVECPCHICRLELLDSTGAPFR